MAVHKLHWLKQGSSYLVVFREMLTKQLRLIWQETLHIIQMYSVTITENITMVELVVAMDVDQTAADINLFWMTKEEALAYKKDVQTRPFYLMFI